MLEFVFFDPRPRQRFADFLRARDVPVEELQDDETCGVVNAIVDAVENPDGRPLCHRPDGMD